MHVAKWGNSLTVRLPKAFVEAGEVLLRYERAHLRGDRARL
jgi:hypothetical protein